jgi:RHS repeat-associated protein
LRKVPHFSRTLGRTTTTYTYDNNDKLLNVNGTLSCSYDLNGNLTSTYGNLPSHTFAYDDENQLTSLTYNNGSVTNLFYYNALGQRYRSRLNGTYWRYLYDGDRVLEELNDSGTMTARYTTEDGSYFGSLLHLYRPSGTLSRFPMYDNIGTARGLVDASGTVTDTYELDTFGRSVSSTGTTPNPYRYGGAWGYITDPSGLEQLGERFYWPELGRFVSQDPIGDGVNWYAYAENEPLRWVDPRGEDVADRWNEWRDYSY